MLSHSNTAIQSTNRYSLLKEIRKNKVSYLLLAPYMTFFIVCLAVPICAAVLLSFTNFNMLQWPKFTGLMNYERMFLEDKIFIKVLINTLKIAVITGPLSYLFCFMFAWMINDLSPKLRSVITLLFYAPSMSSNLYFLWLYIFSGDSKGIINAMLIKFGIVSTPIQWVSDSRTMMPVLILIMIWSSLGASFLSFIAGFQSLDKGLFEAGAIDGIKNRWQELLYITVPQMAPQLMFAAVLQISAAFTAGGVVTQVCGTPSTGFNADTIVTYMVYLSGSPCYEMGYSCALAVVLLSMMLVTNKIVNMLLRKYGTD